MKSLRRWFGFSHVGHFVLGWGNPWIIGKIFLQGCMESMCSVGNTSIVFSLSLSPLNLDRRHHPDTWKCTGKQEQSGSKYLAGPLRRGSVPLGQKYLLAAAACWTWVLTASICCGRAIFWDAFLFFGHVFLISVSLLLCFSACCFSAFACGSAFIVLCFSASPLFCFSAFLLFQLLCFSAFCSSLLLCLITCFSASLLFPLFCFSYCRYPLRGVI